jgi:hypothetical protein
MRLNSELPVSEPVTIYCGLVGIFCPKDEEFSFIFLFFFLFLKFEIELLLF